MKRIYTILVATLFSSNLIAQVEVEQGIFLLEMGSNGFTSQNISSYEGLGGYMNSSGTIVNAEFNDIYDKYTQNSFELSFRSGYFIVNGLAVGIGLDYNSKSINIKYASYPLQMGATDYDESESELIINPMIRYYYGESGIWTQLSYAIASINMDDSNGSYDDSEFPKRSAINILAGYAISLNDYVSLNPTIGYQLTTQTTKDGGSDFQGNNIDEVIISGTLGVQVALTVHLSRY